MHLQNTLTSKQFEILNLRQQSEFSKNILAILVHSYNRLITNRGTCFTNIKFKSFVQELGIKYVLNAVATPRANGQVERFNRTVIDAFRARCHNKKG